MGKIKEEKGELEYEVTRIKKREKRQPTCEIHTVVFKDGREHKHRVYKSKDGFVKPCKVVWDPIVGGTCVDLTETLD